jgi:hypothetical protein
MAAATGVSESSIGRIWRAHGLKPHRVETFKVSNDPRFAEKLYDIAGLYLAPPDNAVVFSVDEKSQIQALDRTQPGLPFKPGRAGTMTHDYKRHGTTTLFAAMNILTGAVVGACQPHHTHLEWLKFLRRIDRGNSQGVGGSHDLRQLCHPQACQGHGVAPQTPQVPRPLHADQRLVAQHGRALLPRHHQQRDSSWRLHERPG